MWPFDKKKVVVQPKPLPERKKVRVVAVEAELKQVKISVVTPTANNYFYLTDEVLQRFVTLDVGPGRENVRDQLKHWEYNELYHIAKVDTYVQSYKARLNYIHRQVGTTGPFTFEDENGQVYTVPAQDIKLIRVIKELDAGRVPIVTHEVVNEGDVDGKEG